MARIVAGIGTSHSPALQLSAKEWELRAAWDAKYPDHWYKGRPVSFAEMVEARQDEGLADLITVDEMQRRLDRCQDAIGALAATVANVGADIAVIIGDDQHESFHDDNMPAFCVFWGDTVDDAPAEVSEEHAAAGLHETPVSNPPATRVSHPGDPALGKHIIRSLIEQGFDISSSKHLPPHADRGLIGHAFNFVYRRLMDNRPVPSVPLFINTYFPPNQPPVKRCYALGKALRRAIESWDSSKTVAIFASGGLSHFAVEEDLDGRIIEGMRTDDEELLTGLGDEHFNSGSSETRNWIVLAGAMAGSDLKMRLVDYIPCYRSLGGTGFGACFAEWLPLGGGESR